MRREREATRLMLVQLTADTYIFGAVLTILTRLPWNDRWRYLDMTLVQHIRRSCWTQMDGKEDARSTVACTKSMNGNRYILMSQNIYYQATSS